MSGHFFWQVRSWGPARSIRPGEDARHSISQLVARSLASLDPRNLAWWLKE